MVDATAPATRQEQTLVLAAEPGAGHRVRRLPLPSRPLVILWAGMVAAFVLFLSFATLRIGAGNWIGRRMSIRVVWSRFLEYLADQGATPAQIMVVVVALAVAVIGSGCLLWFAFALKDAPSDTQVDNAAGT